MSDKAKPDFSSIEARACKRCKGSGETTGYEGEVKACRVCKGERFISAPVYRAVVLACLATRGKNKGSLRASAPCNPFGAARSDQRAYYVWRLARFHGGRDVTMPMTATLFCSDDPFIAELDALSDWLAERTCGTSNAAAARWGAALGYLQADQVPAGLPAAAYSGGPVADSSKPDFELAELI